MKPKILSYKQWEKQFVRYNRLNTKQKKHIEAIILASYIGTQWLDKNPNSKGRIKADMTRLVSESDNLIVRLSNGIKISDRDAEEITRSVRKFFVRSGMDGKEFPIEIAISMVLAILHDTFQKGEADRIIGILYEALKYLELAEPIKDEYIKEAVGYAGFWGETQHAA